MAVVDRRQARREATIHEILATAWRQIHEVGVGELSLRRLARDVGMKAPSLYGYFPSKVALYDALFAAAAVEFQEGYQEAISVPGPRAALEAGLSFYLRFALESPGKFQLLFQRPVPAFEPSRDSFAIAQGTYRLLVSVLERMVEAGEMDRNVLEQRSLDLLTAISSGLASQQLSNEPHASFDQGRWTALIPTVIELQMKHFAPYRGRTKRKEM